MTLLVDRSTTRTIPMDVSRDADHYVLDADLPGIDPTSVDIDVDGRVLSIRAERPRRSTDGVTYLARERSSGSYLRRFTLGQGIDAENISASYDNGVLSVVLPVAEKAKARKVAVAGLPEAPAAEVETEAPSEDVVA